MRVARFLFAALGALALPAIAAAQISTATVAGTVVDESKGVLPGASIVATDLETGRKYETVSDARGAYQLPPLPPGTYKIEAELSGFARTEVPKIELLVGQNASMTLTMRISAVEENLTVRGETPLVDTASSQVAGNVDRRQMEELPLSGRNWLEMTLLVKARGKLLGFSTSDGVLTMEDIAQHRPELLRLSTPDYIESFLCWLTHHW